MVDRDAATLGIAAIAERRRQPAGIACHLVDDIVQFLGGDAGHHVRRERVEDFGGEAAGLAHAREALGTVKLDNPVLGFGAIVGGDGDVLSHGRKIGTEA